MAGSRLEKIGTIYTRTTGLLRSGALSWEDRPLWYDIYEAFPPKEEPRYDRPIPNIKLKQIFYKEDKIRAMFHKNNRHIDAANIANNNYKSLTQRFIENYKKIEAQYDGKASEEQVYAEALNLLKRDRESKQMLGEEEPISLSTAFKEAELKNKDTKVSVNITDLFKN